MVLLIVIVLTFGYSAVKLMAAGSEDNFFNQKLRVAVTRYGWARELFGLHFDGDARYDYLGPRYDWIRIEVDAMEGLGIDALVLSLFISKVEELTGKKASFVISNDKIRFAEHCSREEIIELVEQNQNRYRNDYALLYVLVLNKSAEEPTILGTTHREDGIVIFESAHDSFTANSPSAKSNYMLSTLLHEFGHQLGLPHNNLPDCLMNEHAEFSHTARFDPTNVLTDFCGHEKDLIRAL